MDPLHQKLDALLVTSGEPVRYKDLCRVLACTEAQLMDMLTSYEHSLRERGFSILRTTDAVGLAINPAQKEVVAALIGDPAKEEVGQAGMEILAIIAYKKEATRATIEYIRGVNSSFALRTLLVRGLIERVTSSADAREYVYRPTIALLAHFGVSSVSELPDFAGMHALLAELDERDKESL